MFRTRSSHEGPAGTLRTSGSKGRWNHRLAGVALVRKFASEPTEKASELSNRGTSVCPVAGHVVAGTAAVSPVAGIGVAMPPAIATTGSNASAAIAAEFGQPMRTSAKVISALIARDFRQSGHPRRAA